MATDCLAPEKTPRRAEDEDEFCHISCSQDGILVAHFFFKLQMERSQHTKGTNIANATQYFF